MRYFYAHRSCAILLRNLPSTISFYIQYRKYSGHSGGLLDIVKLQHIVYCLFCLFCQNVLNKRGNGDGKIAFFVIIIEFFVSFFK